VANDSADEQRERELKFDVPDGWQLPDPARLVATGGTVLRESVELETTYFDTVGGDLLRNRLTLRRRTGDSDVGWQLKVPDGDARVEIRLPLGGRGMPTQLRDATFGVRAGAALNPVATLRTDREIHRLVDGEGIAHAEIVVDSELLEFAVTRHWREVEVELIDGDGRFLRRAARWLEKQGATTSTSGSKLARALAAEPSAARDDDTLAGLVGNYLDRCRERIVREDVDLRRGHDTVHATRTATRRYRSVLRAFGSVLDADRAAALDGELAWFAAGLGVVRDLQVLRARLKAVLAELPPELVLGPVSARIQNTLAGEFAQAEAELEKLMRSRRYFALLRELAAWHEQLPVAGDAPAADVARVLKKAERKVRRRLRTGAQAADADAAMHRARKAAKRARYVAELARPELDGRARAAAKRLKKLQRRLGDRQDGVVAAAFLRRLGAAAGTAGENGFTFGLMYERERRRARSADA
jgi:CHAD domain-containing protein